MVRNRRRHGQRDSQDPPLDGLVRPCCRHKRHDHARIATGSVQASGVSGQVRCSSGPVAKHGSELLFKESTCWLTPQAGAPARPSPSARFRVLLPERREPGRRSLRGPCAPSIRCAILYRPRGQDQVRFQFATGCAAAAALSLRRRRRVPSLR